MSRFTPWTEAEAEKWAREIFERLVPHNCKTPDGKPFPVERSTTMTACLEILKKAAEHIEKCPSLYRNASHVRELWDIRRNPEDTHEAKLVGVREVEK